MLTSSLTCVQDDGVCLRRLPRDFTAHMYLNSDFTGGEFVFVDDYAGEHVSAHSLDVQALLCLNLYFLAQQVNEVVKPSCGQVLTYSSGSENMHGVKALTQGERCHVTMWFSQDPRKMEELPLPLDSPFLVGRKVGPGRDPGRS